VVLIDFKLVVSCL